MAIITPHVLRATYAHRAFDSCAKALRPPDPTQPGADGWAVSSEMVSCLAELSDGWTTKDSKDRLFR